MFTEHIQSFFWYCIDFIKMLTNHSLFRILLILKNFQIKNTAPHLKGQLHLNLTNNYCIQQVSNGGFYIYYTHFEITGGLCNLIGSNWCDLFTNRTNFCFKSQLFPANERLVTKNKTTNQISRLVQSNRSNCRKMKDAIKLCQDVLTTE